MPSDYKISSLIFWKPNLLWSNYRQLLWETHRLYLGLIALNYQSHYQWIFHELDVYWTRILSSSLNLQLRQSNSSFRNMLFLCCLKLIFRLNLHLVILDGLQEGPEEDLCYYDYLPVYSKTWWSQQLFSNNLLSHRKDCWLC